MRKQNISTPGLSLFIPLLVCLFVIVYALQVFCDTAQKEPDAVPQKNPAIESGKLKVQKISDKRDLIQGIWANGYIGDYVLENEKIRVIVTSPEREGVTAKGGGQIVDVSLKDYPVDYVRGLYARIGTQPETTYYDRYANVGLGVETDYSYRHATIQTVGLPDNAASLIVSGKSEGSHKFEITTEYTIKPNKPVIEITTTVNNLSTGTLESLTLGEKVDWGACSTFIGGAGVIEYGGEQKHDEVEWFAGFIDNFSAGLTQKKGLINGLFSPSAATINYDKVSIKPGAKASYTRYLVISDKRLSGVSDFAYETRESKFGFVAGKVVDPETKQPVPDVDVRIIVSKKGNKDYTPARPLTKGSSDAEGSFEMTLPEGVYFVQGRAFSRRTAKDPFSFTINDGDTYGLEIKASRSSVLKFTCTDADTGTSIPCKLTFIPVPPTPMFDRGPGNELYARNVYYSATGSESLDVPAGHYKVIFSRGIEYDTYEEEITIAFTKENIINAALKRVIDTKGLICADIGVRTNRSYDCFVSPEDRIVAAAGEGVEYIVSGDSNSATDLSEAAKKVKLENIVKTGIGKKIEYMGEKSLGHILVWPLDAKGAAAAAKNDELDSQNPRDLMKALRSKYPGSFIQVNRPLFPVEGYFTNFGYDHKTKPFIEEKDFSYDFDLLEVIEGKRIGGAKENIQLFFDTRLKGYGKIMPIGGSFSHATWGEEVGYPRIYVASSSDNPAAISEREIAENIKKGNFQITNGPIIKFTVNNMPPGSFIKDTDGSVDCHLEVFAAPWVPLSYIDINMDGIFLRRIILPPSKEIKRFPRPSAPEGSEKFPVKITKDSIINVIAAGVERETLSPVVSSYPLSEGLSSIAITAPIVIDFDGNGKYDPPTAEQIGN